MTPSLAPLVNGGFGVTVSGPSRHHQECAGPAVSADVLSRPSALSTHTATPWESRSTSFALPSANGPAPRPGDPERKARPEDLWLKTIDPTHTGRIHSGCKSFADPEATVGRGPISRVAVYQSDFVHAIPLWYGSDGVGLANGLAEPASGITWEEFEVQHRAGRGRRSWASQIRHHPPLMLPVAQAGRAALE